MHRLIAIILKEIYHIKRDKRTLMLLIVFPAILLLIFGYAVDFDVKNVNIAVFDNDNSIESRELIEKLSHYDYFILKYNLTKFKEIDRSLDAGLITACVVIPEDFSEKIKQGKNVDIQIIIDGTNSNTGMTVLGNLSAYITDYSGNLLINALKKKRNT